MGSGASKLHRPPLSFLDNPSQLDSLESPSAFYFDIRGYLDYLHNRGWAYHFRALQLIEICRHFVAIWRVKSIRQYYDILSIFEKCDIAILRFVEAGKDESEEANRSYEEAVDALRWYFSSYPPNPANSYNVDANTEEASRMDKCSGFKPRNKSFDDRLAVVEFHILSHLSDPEPIIVRQAISKYSTIFDVLWDFARLPGKRHLALAQNPQFYKDLPISPSEYGPTSECRPTEKCAGVGRIYVLTNSVHPVFVECDSKLRIFDNVWNIDNVLIFKNVVGTLQGEAIVGQDIPNTCLFSCRMESQQVHRDDLKQIQKWQVPIYNLLEHPSGCIFITTKPPLSYWEEN